MKTTVHRTYEIKVEVAVDFDWEYENEDGTRSPRRHPQINEGKIAVSEDVLAAIESAIEKDFEEPQEIEEKIYDESHQKDED